MFYFVVEQHLFRIFMIKQMISQFPPPPNVQYEKGWWERGERKLPCDTYTHCYYLSSHILQSPTHLCSSSLNLNWENAHPFREYVLCVVLSNYFKWNLCHNSKRKTKVAHKIYWITMGLFLLNKIKVYSNEWNWKFFFSVK